MSFLKNIQKFFGLDSEGKIVEAPVKKAANKKKVVKAKAKATPKKVIKPTKKAVKAKAKAPDKKLVKKVAKVRTKAPTKNK